MTVSFRFAMAVVIVFLVGFIGVISNAHGQQTAPEGAASSG